MGGQNESWRNKVIARSLTAPIAAALEAGNGSDESAGRASDGH